MKTKLNSAVLNLGIGVVLKTSAIDNTFIRDIKQFLADSGPFGDALIRARGCFAVHVAIVNVYTAQTSWIRACSAV